MEEQKLAFNEEIGWKLQRLYVQDETLSFIHMYYVWFMKILCIYYLSIKEQK